MSVVVLTAASLATLYYGQTEVLAWAGMIAFFYIIWSVSHLWSHRSVFTRAYTGFVFVFFAAITVRLFGVLFMALVFGDAYIEPLNDYGLVDGSLSDVYRTFFNGNLQESLNIVLLAAIGGALTAAIAAPVSNWLRRLGA